MKYRGRLGAKGSPYQFPQANQIKLTPKSDLGWAGTPHFSIKNVSLGFKMEMRQRVLHPKRAYIPVWRCLVQVYIYIYTHPMGSLALHSYNPLYSPRNPLILLTSLTLGHFLCNQQSNCSRTTIKIVYSFISTSFQSTKWFIKCKYVI